MFLRSSRDYTPDKLFRRHLDTSKKAYNSYDNSKYISHGRSLVMSRLSGLHHCLCPQKMNVRQISNTEILINALCRLASKLGGGYACFCDTAQIPVYSSFNWTVQISFDDRVRWVLRSPRTDGAIRSKETSLTLLASEAV